MMLYKAHVTSFEVHHVTQNVEYEYIYIVTWSVTPILTIFRHIDLHIYSYNMVKYELNDISHCPAESDISIVVKPSGLRSIPGLCH